MSIISIVVISAFAIIYFTTYARIQEENQEKIDSIPKLPSIFLARPFLYDQNSGRIERLRLASPRIPIKYSQSFIVFISKDGEVRDIFSYIDMPEENYIEIAEKAWELGKNEGTVSMNERKWKFKTTSLNDKIQFRIQGTQEVIDTTDYYQISFLDITESSNTLTKLLYTLIFVGIGVLFIFFWVSFYFANRAIRPIQESWEKQKQFVADASHELKTPLAIISANTDALLASGEETVYSQKKWIDYIKSEIILMNKLFNDMLYLAKVEETSETAMPIDLSEIVVDTIFSMEAIIYEKGVQLAQNIEPGVVVKADYEKMKQVVIILLDNAVKYVNENGSIHIKLERIRNNAVFSIRNTGEGIPPEKLARIFDRFYRNAPSRSKETGGYGLGLAIARAVIERTGGKIYAESANGSTTFTFELKT